MKQYRIYKDLEISYQELATALVQFGFQDVSDSRRFHFVNPKFKATVLIPLKAPDELVLKSHFVANSTGLCAAGVTREVDDLAKLIERNRWAAPEKMEA